jgi:hypothetical protein
VEEMEAQFDIKQTAFPVQPDDEGQSLNRELFVANSTNHI